MDGLIQVLYMKIFIGKNQYSSRSMVGEVDEHVILGAALQDFPGSDALHCFCIASQHSKEILWGNILSGVVLRDSLIDIRAIGPVDHNSWSGIIFRVSNVVVHHHNDLLVGNPIPVNDLVGMARICLVPIIIPAI